MECPLISCAQKIVIYETKARFYVVGSNNTETRFRVLKIDRTEPKDLVITDDKLEYSQKEIRDVLMMIDIGNRTKIQRGHAGLSRTVSAFGIVGFVKFLEGYYIILITKRRRVAIIGSHTIFKVEDTSMVYIPNDTVRYMHPDEPRYVKMFQNMDLSSNFYFSYSYDLTNTLQYNLTPTRNLTNKLPDQDHTHKLWRTDSKDTHVVQTPPTQDDVEDANKSCQGLLSLSRTVSNPNFLSSSGKDQDAAELKAKMDDQIMQDKDNVVYGVKNAPTDKFVWNSYLLEKCRNVVHPDWCLYLIHGFVAQSNLNVFGHSIFLTLISRRSNQFAGTRFLKRGANSQGAVANDVESEQIVHDASVMSLQKGRFTSYVQIRGSIPLIWSQDPAKMMPKPPIQVDQADPYGYIAGQHFNQVLRRYGSPTIILNLIKKREKKKHESVLIEEFISVLRYLNQFLPPDHSIQYIGFDMARVSKSKDSNVLLRLAEIAEYCVKKTGFFHSANNLYCNDLRPHQRCRGLQSSPEGSRGQHQLGIVRTNCVDCLDRTNTAQFAVGKCALSYQLYSLGIIDSPVLEFDTDCVRMLEELYEDQGDTLALQYGGSNLVHRIKGYRKIAPWTSSSRDIMQTLSRYYSNAFSDAEKQQVMNVFLGMFRPREGQPNIWDLATDFYLHNPTAVKGKMQIASYTQWWDDEVMDCLPRACEQVNKGLDGKLYIIKTHREDERVDGYWEYYKPYELTTFDEHFCYHMPNSIRDFMPKCSVDFSPFAVRVRPGRRQEEAGPYKSVSFISSLSKSFTDQRNTKKEANPNVSGKDSTASTTSTGSESASTSSSEGSDIEGDIEMETFSDRHREDSGLSLVSLKDLFPTMEQTYGVEIQDPAKSNRSLYMRFAQIGQNASIPVSKPSDSPRHSTMLIQKSTFSLDSFYHVTPPTVYRQSKDIYKMSVSIGTKGPKNISVTNKMRYQHYVQKNTQ